MLHGSWDGDPLSVFLCSPVFRPVIHPLEEHQLPGMGLGVSHCGSIPFLFFALLTFVSFCLSLTLMCADPAVAGFRYMSNK